MKRKIIRSMIVFLAVAALLVAAIALYESARIRACSARGAAGTDPAFAQLPRRRFPQPACDAAAHIGKGLVGYDVRLPFRASERNRPDHALPAVKTDRKRSIRKRTCWSGSATPPTRFGQTGCVFWSIPFSKRLRPCRFSTDLSRGPISINPRICLGSTCWSSHTTIGTISTTAR